MSLKRRSVGLAVVVACFACGGAPAPEPVAPAAPPPSPAPAAAPAPVAPAPTAEAPKEPVRSMDELQMRSLREYVKAFNKHDAKAIAALYAEDAVFLERGEFLSAGAGAIETNYKEYFDAFPDATTSITRSWHRGDSVVFEYVEAGTQTGPHRAHKPTGKKVGYAGASLLKFKREGDRGLVTSDTTYSDELTKEVQAGWAPGPLASIKVRPIVTVPPATESWEVHKLAEQDEAKAKASAAQKSLYTSFALRSEKDFLAALSDNVLLTAYDDPADVKGKSGAAGLFKDWTKTFADGKVDTSDAWTMDGYFVVLGTFSAKHVGDWGPVKKTNKTATGHFLDIAKVDKDEKVERLWSYANNYELLAHLGYRKTEVKAK